MMLLYILVLVVIVNSIYFLLFSKFSFIKIDCNASHSDIFPVSVIISAKNESANLKKNLPLWLQQDHPNFELIIINDASVDNTLEVIESFAKEDSRVKIVDIENNETFWGSKKYALTLGIKRAVNQRMLFTDADCYPATNQWIREMARHFSSEKQIILGYGAYKHGKGLLNSLIRYETLMTAIQYFSYAKAGMAYMGVGRNLGYTSSLFYNNRGFISHMKIASGDDDLFVNETATTKNTALSISPTSFTYSTPAKSYKAWILQKRRHITTSKYYKTKHRFLLGSYFIFSLLFWIISISCLIVLDWKIPLGIVVFRFFLQYIVIGKGAKLLKEKNLIFLIPVYELLLVFIQLSIFISNRISKPSRWK